MSHSHSRIPAVASAASAIQATSLCPQCSGLLVDLQTTQSDNPLPGKDCSSWTLTPSGGHVCSPDQHGGHRGKARHQNLGTLEASSQEGFGKFHKMAPTPNLHSQKGQAGWCGQQELHQACPGHLSECPYKKTSTHTLTLTHTHAHSHVLSLTVNWIFEFIDLLELFLSNVFHR